MQWKVILWLGLGVLAAFALNATIVSFVDPILASAKLSVSLSQ